MLRAALPIIARQRCGVAIMREPTQRMIETNGIRLNIAEGRYRIGMNEVAIGLTVPSFAIEIARQRLTPAYFSRAVMTSEMFGPAEAATAGFFDRVVPAAELERAAQAAAQALSTLNMAAHAATKARARSAVITMIRAMIDEDITPQYGEDRVARRA
jgi:enoyl-CoA hydratase